MFGQNSPDEKDPQRMLVQAVVRKTWQEATADKTKVSTTSELLWEAELVCLTCGKSDAIRNWRSNQHYESCKAGTSHDDRVTANHFKKAMEHLTMGQKLREHFQQNEIRNAARIQTLQINKDAKMKAIADRKALRNIPEIHEINVMTWNVRSVQGITKRKLIMEAVAEINSTYRKKGKELDVIQLNETHTDFAHKDNRTPGTIHSTHKGKDNRKGGVATWLRS